MRPELEGIVFDARMKRLSKHKKNLIESRTSALSRTYTALKKTLRASDWAFLPDLEQLIEREQFRSLVYADEDRAVSDQDFIDILQSLPSQIHEEKTKLENAMHKELRDEGHNPTSGLAAFVFRTPRYSHTAPFDDVLRLTVFAARGKPDYAFVSTCRRYVDLASKLVELAGLDVQTATTWDMDRRPAEYICTHKRCAPTHDGVKVYSWRGIVSIMHAVYRANLKF